MVNDDGKQERRRKCMHRSNADIYKNLTPSKNRLTAILNWKSLKNPKTNGLVWVFLDAFACRHSFSLLTFRTTTTTTNPMVSPADRDTGVGVTSSDPRSPGKNPDRKRPRSRSSGPRTWPSCCSTPSQSAPSSSPSWVKFKMCRCHHPIKSFQHLSLFENLKTAQKFFLQRSTKSLITFDWMMAQKSHRLIRKAEALRILKIFTNLLDQHNVKSYEHPKSSPIFNAVFCRQKFDKSLPCHDGQT